MNSKNKTRLRLTGVLIIWMVFLFFFLSQTRYEHSLIFSKILPTGLVIKPIVFITDTSKISPDVDPNTVVLDTSNVDTTLKKPDAFSLRQYAPEVKSQGNLGSCVSWACGYAAFTISKRIEKNNKSLEPFSPLNLYVRYKKSFNENPCSYGAVIPFALNIIKRSGCASFSNFLPNECTKNADVNEVHKEKLHYFDPVNPGQIGTIKSAIASKMPLVFGIRSYNGAGWHNAVLQNGVWSGHYSGSVNGGHAMCIIGYDDSKGGGSFEIMNSWGDDWGDNGFFWIRYSDFAKHVDDCYVLMPKK
jgi:C1A family cysteine protease